jgi:hypothetical protein
VPQGPSHNGVWKRFGSVGPVDADSLEATEAGRPPPAAGGSALNLEVLVSDPGTLTRAQSVGYNQAQAAVIGGLGAQMPVAGIPRA